MTNIIEFENVSKRFILHKDRQDTIQGRFAGLPIQISNLWLSLEDPDAFVGALTEANPGAA